ncbi:MAG TPA: ACT domain-containing protein [Candidatus Thermoplasmatota archaeon]|jgi:aspartokinase|nr:ACT domain-containing protein [Candidatus Thermoplasmatota archaeon]
MPRGASASSTAQVVREYIDSHPSVKDCLKLGIINLSALARRIMDEEGVKSEEAALIACRRYELDPKEKINEAEIIRVLHRSKIEIRTKVAILTARPSWNIYAKLERAMSALRGRNHPLHVIQGTASVTIITDESVAQELVEIIGKEDVLKTQQDLVELVVTSPDVIEEVPGIMAYLSSALASKGINFVEVISCYKDTMFVIDEDDMVKAFETLNRATGG